MKWNKSKDVLGLMVGHGKSLDGSWDPGCTYSGYTEAGLMQPIVEVAAKWLRKSGVKVLTDADDKNNRNMKSSVAWANNKGADIYMSVHCDYSGASSGIMFYYGDSTDKKLGDTVCKSIAKTMDMKNKGGKKDLAKFEVNSPKAKYGNIILETGGIKADLKKLKDYKKYGKAIAKAICKYIGVPIYVSKTTKLYKKTLEILAYMNAHKFKYCKSYKKCGTSWAKAKKTHRSNCATAMSYSLQELGYLKSGQIFWINGDKIRCVGKGTSGRLKKYFKITHPKKVPSKAGLKQGDICGYSPAHTQMFSKMNSKKLPLWLSWGKIDPGRKQPVHKKTYDKKTIKTRLRLK